MISSGVIKVVSFRTLNGLKRRHEYHWYAGAVSLTSPVVYLPLVHGGGALGSVASGIDNGTAVEAVDCAGQVS